jgi:hypothetical protein
VRLSLPFDDIAFYGVPGARIDKTRCICIAYCRESIADARRRGTKLADEIKTCTKWQVICIDPEHLKSKEWREISDFPEFRSKLVFAITDEAHLINEWGAGFRVDFKFIGIFIRGRLPPSIVSIPKFGPGHASRSNFSSVTPSPNLPERRKKEKISVGNVEILGGVTPKFGQCRIVE